ncbi:MAG: helicase, partial [Bacteroidota bacterium]
GGAEGGESFNLSNLGDQTSNFEQGGGDSVFKGSKMNLPPEDFDPLNSPF